MSNPHFPNNPLYCSQLPVLPVAAAVSVGLPRLSGFAQVLQMAHERMRVTYLAPDATPSRYVNYWKGKCSQKTMEDLQQELAQLLLEADRSEHQTAWWARVYCYASEICKRLEMKKT